MRYLLKQITIYEGQNDQGPYSWLQARLFNDADVFGNPAQLPRYYNMTEEVVAMYKPYAVLDSNRSTKDPSTGRETKVYNVNAENLAKDIEAGKLGDILHIDQIFSVVVPLPGWYARIHKTDIVQNGVPIAKKGDFVKNAAGEVVPVDSLELYLKKFQDPNEMDPTKAWKWVESPERAMRNVLSRNYRQYNMQPSGAAPTQTAPAAPTASPELSLEEQLAQAKAALAEATAGNAA